MMRYMGATGSLGKKRGGGFKNQFRGAYATLIEFFGNCKQNGCKPLSDKEYNDLIGAVEALSASPEGDAYRRKTINFQMQAIDENDRGMLYAMGIPGVGHRPSMVAEHPNMDGSDIFGKTLSTCSSMQLEEGSIPDSASVQDDDRRLKKQGTFASDMTEATLQTYKDDDTDEEYERPRQDSVRLVPRATRFLGKDTMTVNCSKVLGAIDFDPSPFVLGFERDVKAQDMHLLIHMLNIPFGLIDEYFINESRLMNWLGSIADQYCKDNPYTDRGVPNPYHNWPHALEVTQFCYYNLTTGQGSQYFNRQDILALITSCIAHDVAHPGINAAHIIRTGHELAIRYNDKTPIENMHAYRFFETLTRPKHDFLHRHQGFKTFRQKVIRSILSTDLAEHFNFVDKFSTRVSKLPRDPLVVTTRDGVEAKEASKAERGMLLEAFIHVADLGPNCKPFTSHIFLVKNLEEEWFRQGDQEMALGLPVSPNFNRATDSAACLQHFFLECMVLPLIDPFSNFINNECYQMMKKNTQENIAGWDAALAQHGKESAATLALKLLSPDKLEKWDQGIDDDS